VFNKRVNLTGQNDAPGKLPATLYRPVLLRINRAGVLPGRTLNLFHNVLLYVLRRTPVLQEKCSGLLSVKDRWLDCADSKDIASGYFASDVYLLF
jgi:hypothetical protein